MNLVPFIARGPVRSSENFFIILQEKDKNRLCYVTIDLIAGHCLALQLQGVQSVRPLTHQLIFNTLVELGCVLDKIVITQIIDNSYRATLYIKNPDKLVIEIDSRPSDAITLAIIAGCPMLINEDLLEMNEELRTMVDAAEKQAKTNFLSNKEMLPKKMTEEEAAEFLKNFDPGKKTH